MSELGNQLLSISYSIIFSYLSACSSGILKHPCDGLNDVFFMHIILQFFSRMTFDIINKSTSPPRFESSTIELNKFLKISS